MRWRLALLSTVLAATAAQGRDLSAFTVLQLQMPAANAFVAPSGDWAFDTQLGYQNTWSMSPNVQDYFESRGVRRRLDAADIATIQALPYTKFLVDVEMGVLDFTVHRRIDEHWSAFATLSAVSYDGGFMDGPIERFHSALGFREYVRGAVPRDQVTIIAETGTTHYVQQGAPSDGLLDPNLGIRYRTGPFVIDGAVKIPLGGTRAFRSNGGVDVGVQATWRDNWGPHSAFASVAGVSTSGGGVLETHGRYFVPTLVSGYEYAFGQGTSAFLQGHATRYALDSTDTDIGGLRQYKMQVMAGVRHRSGHSTFTFNFTEGFGAYNGLPDFGLQLGWTVD